MEITLLVLFHWLAANILAVTSLVLALTPLRGKLVANILASSVGTYGILLSMNQGIPDSGLHPIHLLSWFPILAACVSITVWYRSRNCCRNTRVGPEGRLKRSLPPAAS